MLLIILMHAHDPTTRGCYDTAPGMAHPSTSAPTRLLGWRARLSLQSSTPSHLPCPLSAAVRDTCCLFGRFDFWLTLFALVLVSRPRPPYILPGKRRAEKRAAVIFIMAQARVRTHNSPRVFGVGNPGTRRGGHILRNRVYGDLFTFSCAPQIDLECGTHALRSLLRTTTPDTPYPPIQLSACRSLCWGKGG